ncbi:RING finger protein unkempt isoform X2 [Frankliniella occidentalis]|uniref:RING finger protein unkempt isoform X2 n=1 Tax=Frankliniella occidentalis TaxID=133901 RepID=A0A6J1SKA3_FRAOC|nr:RING finger protein unkempt isoform X2 [Frankliniella occidentalis]
MPSEAKPLLTAQTEKPNHYSYLKEFRVEQCPLFLQHKCTQHRPYTCFHWHFMNQRRRRPVRKRDGAFNYSADNYCTKFDETTGLCPEGDDCPYLHRTAGDTERRYHLRYYKTCMCVHDTDSRGLCVKNGPHCAFAHGTHDIRPPVYDIKEIQAAENPDGDPNSTSNGPNVLDKERNLMNEDPKWQDTNYVLANYKTEQCKRPPRLCRQGYACPQFHNSRDKRRSPRKFKYRSTPCPSVKHGDEWGEPSNCESGDACQYCHTRTEQQFHPEIYKSTKCNDVQQAGYCPRGVFCAFAHVDQMSIARDIVAPHDSGTNLAEILSSALPAVENNKQNNNKQEKGSDSSAGSGEVSESASTSSLCSNSSHSKAPGAQLAHNRIENNHLYNQQSNGPDILNGGLVRNSLMSLDNDSVMESDKNQRKQNLYMNFNQNSNSLVNSLGLAMSPMTNSYYSANDTIESVVGNALDDLNLDDALNLAASMDRDFETESPTISNSISAGLASSGILSGSAPVNIPGSTLNDRANCLGNFSPSTSSPLHHLGQGFLSASRFSHQDSLDSNPAFLNHHQQHPLQMSSNQSKMGSNHFPIGSGSGNVGNMGGLGYEFNNLSPGGRPHANHIMNNFPISPSIANNSFNKLREEMTTSRSKMTNWDDGIVQARKACEAWQREAEEANTKANIAERQRDEALSQVKILQGELELRQGGPFVHALRRVSELRTLSLPTLKNLQAQLKTDLEEIEKVLYQQTASKCMVCEEQERSVTLSPCNHLALCAMCAPKQKECPYCQIPIAHTTHSTPTTTVAM